MTKQALIRLGYPVARLGFRLIRAAMQALLLAYHRARYRWIDGPRRARAPVRIHAGEALGLGRWCLAALYQPGALSPNLRHYLAAWRAAGYDIVAVHDGPLPPDSVLALLPLCHTLIERPKGGIDVGSYQVATRHLARLMGEGARIDQVVYCNDSVFVRPSTLPDLIARLRAATAPVTGVFENHDPHPHIQSWLFALAGPVFADPVFQRFWAEYVPLDHRPAIIRTGEIGLADCLRARFGPPAVLWPAERAVAAVLAHPDIAAHPDRYAGQVLRGRYLRKALAALTPPLDPATVAGIQDLAALPADRLGETLLAAARCFNPGAVFTLMLAVAESFPILKKDLVFKAVFPLDRVERCLNDWRDGDAADAAESLAYYRRRGTLRDDPLTHLRVRSGLA